MIGLRRAVPTTAVLTLIAALLAVGPVGCASDPPPADHFYDLIPEDSGRRFGEPILDGTLVVERFTAEGVLSERPVLYKPNGGAGLRQYSYHYWSQSPGLMLRDAAIREYRRAGVAKRVVSPAMRLLPAYRMTGSVSQLYHERRSGTATAVLAVEITISRARDGQPVLLETYRRRQRVDSRKIEAAVQAFQAALTDIVARSMDDLAARARG
jgi:ABC-type uncharacterized transport system auxiliary subunit